MRLKVRHRTIYDYDGEISSAIQVLRLTPLRYAGQEVLRWRIRGESRRDLPQLTDGYGNRVAIHSVPRPHSRSAVFVEGEVETRETQGIVEGADEPLPPLFFLRSTRLTHVEEALLALAYEGRREAPQLERMHALMGRVNERIAFNTGTTEVTTTAAEALAAGEGVCQDHTHVMIACARVLGLPARYVSGYLWAGEGTWTASHAWAEVLIEDLGWVGFDAANGVCPTEHYIRNAIGLDYHDAAPVRGLRRGLAQEHMTVSVEVEPLPPSQPLRSGGQQQ